MQYREFEPVGTLSGYVECFWLLEGAIASVAAPERLLPDGCVELIVNLGARFREFDEAGRSALQPACLVVGQMTRPVLVAPTGTVELLGRYNLPFGPIRLDYGLNPSPRADEDRGAFHFSIGVAF